MTTTELKMCQYHSPMKSLRYLVPSSVTALALACGVMAIIQGTKGHPMDGAWWVLYATILDRLDGLTARALNASTRIGVWFDSVSDFVAFGVAPAFLLMGVNPGGFEPVLLLPMGIYIGGAGLRLLRFSLQEAAKEFRGVPSTLAGGVYAVGLHTALKHGMGADYLWLFAGVLIVFGIAMNTPWLRYGKVGGLSSRWLNYLGVGTVATCAVLIVLKSFPEFVFGASALIMITAPIISRVDSTHDVPKLS